MSNQAMVGMEIQAIRSLARTMDQRADEIDKVVAAATQRVTGLNWRGTDRERFVSEWDSRHAARLRQASSGLRQAAENARARAAEQERVSRSM